MTKRKVKAKKVEPLPLVKDEASTTQTAETIEPMAGGVPPSAMIVAGYEETQAIEVAPEKPKTLEEQLLDYWKQAPPGPIDAEKLAEELNTTAERLSQAWDRLYDFHKICFAKFVKPE